MNDTTPDTATDAPAEPADPPPAAVQQPARAPAAASAAPSRPIGVLIVNLGTPDATDPVSVRRYLQEFLADKRVIEDNSLTWKIVLNGFILRFRPRRKGKDYEKIWNREKNESPLKTITRAQAEKLAAMLDPAGGHIAVDWAMRYGNPSIASRLSALAARGCDRILVIPLYPQYAAATTATVCDEVFRVLMRMRAQPTVRVAAPYFDDATYIDSLASTLQAELRKLDFVPEVILASYHGIPVDYALKGDPYPSHCATTTRLLRERLGLDESKLMMTFQSRFGRAEWLKPYTDQTVKSLAKRGVKNMAVLTPGFSADCLETLEEIAVENAEIFHRHGGEKFAAIPCLNDSEPGMLVIWQLAQRELKGWL
jgi:protoporphyrin/coproporphyrin ferrochelatase